jgi:hypothetical protein
MKLRMIAPTALGASRCPMKNSALNAVMLNSEIDPTASHESRPRGRQSGARNTT